MINPIFGIFGIFLLSIVVSACGSSSGKADNSSDGTDDPNALPRADIRDVDQLYPYRATSPYVDILKSCAQIEFAANACSLEALPFITQATPNFTREDILDRLLVTHAWMGERFEAILNDAPELMIPMFGSITAISIGSTVRPSNYWAGTGAIELDPAGLWLTVLEKSNVSIVEDYRSGFGDDLSYWSVGTLRDGDQPAIRYYSLIDTEERTIKDIKIPLYRLLYHELAHAVDYLPSAAVATLDASLTPVQALTQGRQYRLSPQLYLDMPLTSQAMLSLGQVSFHGADATSQQISFSSDYIGSEMSGDGAVRYYGYSTEREDFATLFATAMMKLSFNLDYYLAFVQKPADEEDYQCGELLVGWGERNRLADSTVRIRAKRVMEQIYGSASFIDDFFQNDLGEKQVMTPGVDWCTNRDSSSANPYSVRAKQGRLSDRARLWSMENLEAERLDYVH